jgi:hypothetical protein
MSFCPHTYQLLKIHGLANGTEVRGFDQLRAAMNNAMSYYTDGVVAQVKLAIIHLHDQKGSSFKSIKDVSY